MRITTMVLRLVVALALCGQYAYAQMGDATNGASLYAERCASCHGSSGGGDIGPSLIGCGRCDSLEALYEKIDTEMPQGNPEICADNCAWDTAAYIYETLNRNDENSGWSGCFLETVGYWYLSKNN